MCLWYVCKEKFGFMGWILFEMDIGFIYKLRGKVEDLVCLSFSKGRLELFRNKNICKGVGDKMVVEYGNFIFKEDFILSCT